MRAPARPALPRTRPRIRRAPATSDDTPARRAAAGLAPLITLVILLAALPAFLLAISGSPIPHSLPTWHRIAAALTRPDVGTLFTAAIRWISWIAWATFALSALTEGYAQLKGRPAPALPLTGPIQPAVATLVSTAILGPTPVPHLPRAAQPDLSLHTQIAASASVEHSPIAMTSPPERSWPSEVPCTGNASTVKISTGRRSPLSTRRSPALAAAVPPVPAVPPAVPASGGFIFPEVRSPLRQAHRG